MFGRKNPPTLFGTFTESNTCSGSDSDLEQWTLSQDLTSTPEHCFFEDPDVTDVTLLVEDKPLHVSKRTLIQASPVFRAMFTSGFKEKDAKEITLPDKKYESFALFLRCILPDEYIELNEEKIGKILPLANEYDVCALKQNCQRWLLNEMRIKLLRSRIPDFHRDVQRDLEFFIKCLYYGAEYDLKVLYKKAFDLVIVHKASRFWDNQYYGLLTEKQKNELLESRMKKIEASIEGSNTGQTSAFGLSPSKNVKQSTRQITIQPDLFQ